MEYHVFLPTSAAASSRIESPVGSLDLGELVELHYQEETENRRQMVCILGESSIASPYLELLVGGEMACVFHYTDEDEIKHHLSLLRNAHTLTTPSEGVA